MSDVNDIVNALLAGKHPLSEQMTQYIATPWCECSPKQWKACNTCEPPIEGDKVPTQSHGGDLFQHSQWTALYLENWARSDAKYPELHAILNDVLQSKLIRVAISDDNKTKLTFIKFCGFMHDIGKGGDNIYDMYQENKYGPGTSDGVHPSHCAEALVNPGTRYGGDLAQTLKTVLPQFKLPQVALFMAALCAHTHWEFGKLSFPPDKREFNEIGYIILIRRVKDELESKLGVFIDNGDDFITLIKLCMALSCADVASAYNDEIDQAFVSTPIAPKTHPSSGGAWTSPWANFRANHVGYVRKISNILNDGFATSNAVVVGGKRSRRKRRSRRRLRSRRR